MMRANNSIAIIFLAPSLMIKRAGDHSNRFQLELHRERTNWSIAVCNKDISSRVMLFSRQRSLSHSSLQHRRTQPDSPTPPTPLVSEYDPFGQITVYGQAPVASGVGSLYAHMHLCGTEQD